MSVIQYPTIEELKYVNGTPNPDEREDQESINWIQNGEPVQGASNEVSSDGVLNRPSVALYDNLTTVHENVKLQQEALTDVIDAVNLLTGSANADLGERVTLVETDNVTLNSRVTLVETKIGQDGSIEGSPKSGLYKLTDDNKLAIGSRHPSDVAPTVEQETLWGDSWWVKSTIIGNKQNYDPNGNYDPINYPTSYGIQGELQNYAAQVIVAQQDIADHETRINAIETSTTTHDISDLREDVGSRANPAYNPSKDVFTRLGEVEDSVVVNTQSINDIEADISSVGGILERITNVEQDVSNNSDEILNLQQSVSDIETDIGTYALSGTIKENIELNADEIQSIWSVVGDSNWNIQPTSIRYKLNDVEVQSGTKASDLAINDTLWGYINQYLKSSGSGSITNHEARIIGLEMASTNYDPRINFLEGAIGDSGGSLGQGFTLNDSASLSFQFLNGTTNPTLPILTASHANNVNIGNGDYQLNLIGSSVKFNNDQIVTVSGATFTGAVKGISPVADGDFATKGWVDQTFVPLAGGQLTGQLKGIIPVDADDLVRKDWVETEISTASFIPLTGGTITGDIISTGLSKTEFGEYAVLGVSSNGSVTINGGNLEISHDISGNNTSLLIGNETLRINYDSQSHDIYHEGNKPNISDLNGVEEAPNNSNSYVRKGLTWETTPIQSDAPSNGKQYIRKDASWLEFSDPQDFSNTIVINDVSNFPGVTADTPGDIVLQNEMTYFIQGSVDIGLRKFRMDTSTGAANINCAIVGNDSLTSKLISATTSPLFTGESIGLYIEKIGISTGNKRGGDDFGTGLGDVFNITKPAGFSFVTLKNVDIDNCGGLGTVADVNKFEWSGTSFATFLHSSAGNCALKFVGDVDIITIDGLTPHRWTGELFDMNGLNCSAQNVQFKNLDIKISEPTQRIFSPSTNDSSLSSTGIGTLKDLRVRKHHDVGLGTITDQQFSDNVRSNYFLGGISQNSINWTILNSVNIRNSETYAIVADINDTPGVVITTTPQVIIGNSGLLTNAVTDMSRTVYTGSTGAIQYQASEYGRKQIEIDWAFIPSSTFTLTLDVVIESVGQPTTTVSVSRQILSTTQTTVHVTTGAVIGEGDTITVMASANASTTIRSLNCALRLL